MVTADSIRQRARNASTTNLRVAVELGRALRLQCSEQLPSDDYRQFEATLRKLAMGHLLPSSDQGRLLSALAEGFQYVQ